MNVKKLAKKIGKGIWKGIKDNKEEIITMTVFCLAVLLVNDTGFASSTSGIDALDTPISKLESVLTGPIPKVGSTIAIAVGGLGWAMGTEQQITKFATRAAVGGGIAVGSTSMVTGVLSHANGALF